MTSDSYYLPESMTIAEVDSLKDELIAQPFVIGTAEPVIDGSKVCSIDAAGVQLILSLYKYLSSEGRELRIDNPSEKLLWAIKTSGADQVLTL